MILTIHLDRLVENYRFFRRRAPVMGVVKADAYGVGMEAVARTLSQAGCTSFFVAYPEEGQRLRALLPQASITVFNGLTRDTVKLYKENALNPVINTQTHISLTTDFADVAVQVETGMHRSGLAGCDWEKIPRHPWLLFSHLACADQPSHALNQSQLEAFRQAVALLKPKTASLAASYGALLPPGYHFDALRVGAGLYGAIRHEEIQPLVTLTAEILEVRRVDKGDPVGYGATFTAPCPGTVATVAVGYADGYPRALSNKGKMVVAGYTVPVIGRVSMDLTTLDVSAVPPGLLENTREAIVYGTEYDINDAARDADTIGYEILTGLGQRLTRVYQDSPA
jgi:alanine racemase